MVSKLGLVITGAILLGFVAVGGADISRDAFRELKTLTASAKKEIRELKENSDSSENKESTENNKERFGGKKS